MIITADITGGAVLAALAGFVLVWFLIDRHYERTPLFQAFPAPATGAAPELAPFPGDPVPLPAPVAPAAPEYVRTALDGHDDADGWVESRWRKIDGQMLAAQIRDGAP